MPGRDAKILVVLCLAVILGFLGLMFAATDGHFIPQVVDLYLVCQYARAMAEGHPFHYNAGEAASTGATSLLHTALLAAADGLGARGEGLVAFAILVGACLYLGTVLLARRVAASLAGAREGLVAGGLVALGGPVVWGFLYGSDSALFLFLSLWLLHAALRAWRDGDLAQLSVAGMLVALARPEGLPIGLLLGAAWCAGPGRGRNRRSWILAWLPASCGIAVLALYRVVSGHWLGSSIADKSLLPNYGLGDSLALVSEYGVDVVRGLLLGFYPSQVPVGFARGWASLYFPPLGLLLVLVCLARLREPLSAPVQTWSAIVAVVLALLAPNLFVGVHFNRYVLWALPTLLVLAAVGLGMAAAWLSREDAALDRSLFRLGAGLWLLLGLLSTLRFAALYGEMAGEVYRRDFKTAEWISRSLPRGVAMANVATSVEYLTGHRSVNLHGVTSPAFYGNHKAEREAGVLEALARLPQAERPPYLITSVAVQEGSALMRALVEGEPLYRSMSLGDELLIYRMRYDLVGKSGRLFLPEARRAVEELREVDRLNVCDSRDEAAHSYSFSSQLGALRLHGTARIEAYPGPPQEIVADGGRAIVGSESFTVQTVRGRDLVVALRTASAVDTNVLRASGSGTVGLQFPEAGLTVEVEGTSAGRWSFRPRPGWDEQLFRIPAALVAEDRTRITLSGRYAAFQYWFYQ